MISILGIRLLFTGTPPSTLAYHAAEPP